MRLYRLRKKSAILSSRAQRGICFFTNTRKKADSSGKPRPRNDSFGVFPQPLKPRPTKIFLLPHKLFSLRLLLLHIQKRQAEEVAEKPKFLSFRGALRAEESLCSSV